MSFVKENGGPVAIALIALGIGATYLEMRINSITAEKVSEVKTIPVAKIEAMEGDIADNKDYIRKTEDKVERIVAILLEPDE